MSLDISVCLPREAETVAMIRTAVTNTLALFGVDEECVDEIRIGVSEACANVVQHATTDDVYEVRVHADGERCTISIRNAGAGFGAAPLGGVMPHPESARGRGVAIIHAVMDGVEFASEPKAGTIVHLVKRLRLRDDGPMVRLRALS